MVYVPLERITDPKASLYKLVLAAAQRANELNLGAKSLVESRAKKVTTIALEEFGAAKVRYRPLEKSKEKEKGEAGE